MKLKSAVCALALAFGSSAFAAPSILDDLPGQALTDRELHAVEGKAFCSPYPLCLASPAQKANNLLANLPSRTLYNPYITGTAIPGLRSRYSPYVDYIYYTYPYTAYSWPFRW